VTDSASARSAAGTSFGDGDRGGADFGFDFGALFFFGAGGRFDFGFGALFFAGAPRLFDGAGERFDFVAGALFADAVARFLDGLLRVLFMG
jgi:hypothetical protein